MTPIELAKCSFNKFSGDINEAHKEFNNITGALNKRIKDIEKSNETKIEKINLLDAVVTEINEMKKPIFDAMILHAGHTKHPSNEFAGKFHEGMEIFYRDQHSELEGLIIVANSVKTIVTL